MNAMNGSPSSSLSAPRVTPHALHAFGGIWRLTFRRFLVPGPIIGGVVGLTLLTLLTLSIVHGRRPMVFSNWTAGFYLTFLVPLLAFLSGGGAMRDEMKPSSVDYVLTRPVRRTAFVVFKFLSHLACVQAIYLVALAAILICGRILEIPDLGAMIPRLVFAQLLTVMAFTAFGFFCATLTSRFLVIGLFYGGVVEVGIGNIPTQLSRLSLLQQVRSLLQPVMQGIPVPTDGLPSEWSVVLFVTGFTVLAVGAAALWFSLQELAGAKAARDA
jgi:ABC-type transport system involved in multi-copper enzyme maturation permease subunit